MMFCTYAIHHLARTRIDGFGPFCHLPKRDCLLPKCYIRDTSHDQEPPSSPARLRCLGYSVRMQTHFANNQRRLCGICRAAWCTRAALHLWLGEGRMGQSSYRNVQPTEE